MNTPRDRAQQLLNHLAPDQVDAVVHLMEVMLDPLSRKLALAPVDDEPFTEQDREAVAEADQWLQHNQPIPLENVLADFGLTMNDWETMAKRVAFTDPAKADIRLRHHGAQTTGRTTHSIHPCPKAE